MGKSFAGGIWVGLSSLVEPQKEELLCILPDMPELPSWGSTSLIPREGKLSEWFTGEFTREKTGKVPPSSTPHQLPEYLCIVLMIQVSYIVLCWPKRIVHHLKQLIWSLGRVPRTHLS